MVDGNSIVRFEGVFAALVCQQGIEGFLFELCMGFDQTLVCGHCRVLSAGSLVLFEFAAEVRFIIGLWCHAFLDVFRCGFLSGAFANRTFTNCKLSTQEGKMRILFAGHEGRYNRGCEAIICATQRMLRERMKDPQFVLSSFEYQEDSLSDWGDDLKIIPAKSNAVWTKYSFDWFLAKLYRRISRDKEWDLVLKPITRDIAAADVVLSVGGDNYTDDYVDYYDPLRYYLQLNRFVKDRKKKLVIWGASVGPFKKTERLDYVVECLNLADLLTIRESISFKYLQQLGVRNIQRVADPAFLLPVEPVDDPVLGHMKDSEFLGFNISPLIADYLSTKGKHYVVEECAKFLDEVLNNTNRQVLLVPHVFKKEPSNNDRIFMEQIRSSMAKKSRCHLPQKDYNCKELKFLISKCRYFMGARTHSTIAALSTGVPTISIGYSQKAQAINQDVFNHLDYVLDYKNLTSVTLKDKFDFLVSDESRARKSLELALPAVKDLSWRNFECLEKLIRGT